MDVYEIIKTIGSGSFGQVYLARHKREGKNYVIKRVKTRDMSQKDLENTENEVRLLQRIRHTNIVSYKDSYVDREQYLNIVMIYCDGGDIYTKIKASKGKNFSEEVILDWLVQMALALLYLHERKILHRDMKTQNIFLKNGKIRLGDFGIAKVLDSTKDFANTCIGTPYYMSPELFKNSAYSYKSDVWALGCVLYEMCNLRHAFDAQSINGLAVKILRGSYPPVNSMYSKQLRDLIGRMLSVKPQQRPTVLDILNKMIVRKRVTKYFNDCLNGPAPELAATDVNDMYVDSLKEQAEKLMIPGNCEDNSAVGRLSSGQSGVKNGQAALLQARRVKKMQAEVKKAQEQSEKQLQTDQEKKKEVMKLRRELNEKERLEKKMKEIEDEANRKELEYREKYSRAQKRRDEVLAAKKEKASNSSKPDQRLPPHHPNQQKRVSDHEAYQNKNEDGQRSNSVPANRGQAKKMPSLVAVDDGDAIEESKREVLNQHSSEARIELMPGSKPKRGRPNVVLVDQEDTPPKKQMTPVSKDNSSKYKMESKPNTGSQAEILTDGPLNTYQDFKNVFNAKKVGPKTNRRQVNLPTYLSSDNLRSNEDRSIRSSSHSIQNGGKKLGGNAEQINLGNQKPTPSFNENSPLTPNVNNKQRILAEKEAKKRFEQMQHEQELNKIRKDAFAQNAFAKNLQQDQYSASYESYDNNHPKGMKKIQEDYTMFDEQKDEDLEDIIEQPIEEESCSGDSDDGDGLGDAGQSSMTNAMKQHKAEEKEDLRNLRTQLLTMKEDIARKTAKIETIRDTLKNNKVKVEAKNQVILDIEASADDNEIDAAVKQFGVDQGDNIDDIDERSDLSDRPEMMSDDEDDDLMFDENDEDLQQEDFDEDIERENFQHETDPQVLKLTDKIKLFRHKLVSSLGYNMYENALEFLKDQVARNTSSEEKRAGLINILGEESIGFWVILDQIIFYEDLVVEIKQLAQMTGRASSQQTGASSTPQQRAY